MSCDILEFVPQRLFPSFTKFLINLMMITICEKVRLHQYNTLRKSLDFLLSCFESRHIFQIM